MRRLRFALLVMPGLCVALSASAQKYPERSTIRSGNKQYEKGDYVGAEVSYRRALEQNPRSGEAAFNLVDALYKQELYDEAAQVAVQVAADSSDTGRMAKAYYNQGNALFQQRKLKEALEAYKSSLRLNPADQEAKFNLAYTKKLLEQDKDNQDQQNDKNQDQDQQNDKNQNNKNPDQDKNDPKNDPKQDQSDKDQGKNDEGKQPPPQMSKEEAERMLDAMQGNEDNTKEKMEGDKVKMVGRSGKNW